MPGHAQLFQSPFGDSMGITVLELVEREAEAFQSPFGDSMGITHDVRLVRKGYGGFNPLSGIPWG